ncbi:MAG: hypothetical protein K9N48_01525 [Verrucomicrobia bacterium]|nr:hypothetical protein [Verrucomicrobiota bacterium]MCF7707386.1 hypothetical protein [Verrucomicrobiota bacterium]
MNKRLRPKGTRMSRVVIYFFTLVFAVLVYWLLGFVVKDIKTLEGPNYNKIEAEYVDKALLDKKESLEKRISETEREISDQREEMQLISDSSRNLQETINQLLELKKTGIQNNVEFSEKEEASFTDSLALFLENQRNYQEMNEALSELIRTKQGFEEEKKDVEQQIEEQRVPAREEYRRLMSNHKFKLASLQLAVLIPLLAIATFLIIKKRGGLYFPLFLAFGGAVLLKVVFVVHEYFPKRYFKYILILVLLAVIGKMLVYLIRAVAFPKEESLRKQYREAYERFLCPVCEYPIRIGPRRFLYWTRRTVNKTVGQGAGECAKEEPYTCPACGTVLFKKCDVCGEIRHSLLPNCRHCGAEI